MKAILTLALLLSCSMLATAQVNQGGELGPATGNPSQSTGFIPDGGNERLRNRPDSTRSDADTTYMRQQWNDGSSQKQQPADNKRSKSKASSTSKTGAATKKKN